LKKQAIVWFRNDLRIHDNESLTEAMEAAENVLPVYIFDDRVFKSRTKFGFKKTGVFRAKFIIESIIDLRNSLASIGLPLIIRSGITENIIYELAREIKSSWVFCNRERTQEEVNIQDALERKLWTIGQEVRYNRGKMLYYTADLPFPVTQTPDVFSQFRKEVEKYIPVREPLPVPSGHTYYNMDVDPGAIPHLRDLGFKKEEIEAATACPYRGGESAAISRLKHYFWEVEGLSNYKETRNQLLGLDYSSKFSPYLAQGCLSPKFIYAELKRYESKVKKNNSTYWLFFELLWRDFFRLMGKKHGNKIFQIRGPKNIDKSWTEDSEAFNAWATGNTGIPFIDANMRELYSTGFMSNRGRQNVASFLVNDLGINWLLGAEYFESLLVDYDPCSNYGNWNYLAGVGSDPRENRHFNILSQAKRYDPEGAYIKHWLPELSKVPPELLFSPFQMSEEQQIKYEVAIGKEYPEPILDFDWV